ncbi:MULTISPECIES: DUF3618 domain-containing protein [unclassified Micromonospora]|uniref:DUF3618 domain-containing protein n=1 Tax=unclassified Micromonospora TaxID=2617518 RepID=UPI002DDB75CF|nr:DUF3618 domain-containing protein [Micromonospora sp. NBC_01813]WSA11041.1 DUF3618 domain-containing protein [Micromonospora sp. NBC_01813]
MTANNGRNGNGTGDLDLLRAEIRQTRAELGQTVQALAAKTDVKSRVRLGAARTGQRLRDQAGRAVADARRTDLRGAVPVIVLTGVTLTAVVVWLMTKGRRR